MSGFNPKICFSKNKALVIDLLDDGHAITIDHTVPPELRTEALDQKAFEQFWQFTFPLWLVDDQYAIKVSQGTKDNPVNI